MFSYWRSFSLLNNFLVTRKLMNMSCTYNMLRLVYMLISMCDRDTDFNWLLRDHSCLRHNFFYKSGFLERRLLLDIGFLSHAMSCLNCFDWLLSLLVMVMDNSYLLNLLWDHNSLIFNHFSRLDYIPRWLWNNNNFIIGVGDINCCLNCWLRNGV